jgi:quinol monooxygenase YgiN
MGGDGPDETNRRDQIISTKGKEPHFVIYTHVTYRIRNDRVNEARQEIAAFVESLKNGPPRFHSYHIFQHANDTASYIHLISFKTLEAQAQHMQSAPVRRFVDNMVSFCIAGPIYAELNPVFATGDSAAAVGIS